MKTKVFSPKGKEVVIGENLSTVLIGERINPFRKGPIKEALMSGDMNPICEEALKQVAEGADILNVNVNAFGIDESIVLPRVVSEIIRTVDVTLCLESRNPVALEKTLKLGCGRPIINSVTGEERILEEILPLVKKYHTSVVAIASDEIGIPKESMGRVSIIRRIIEKSAKIGISLEDILFDCISESSAVSDKAAIITLETMRAVKHEFGVNLILGASNVSFGLPNRKVINAVFLAIAIQAGLNCAIVNAREMKTYIMAVDLLMGRDQRAQRYIAYHRKL